MEERKWIKQAKKGDHEAFARLFREHYPFLVKYLIKVTMNRDQAEELAQETMAKCVEKIHQYNGKSKFSSWLISIATNRYIDLQRKKNREKDWQKEEMNARKLKWELESRNEEWNDVLSALSTLSEDIRLPIILKHYYGYSYEEIGHMTDIPPGTVKSRVHHGINRLRKELKIDEK
ncbi:RNA polymerase sigma factor SigY [Rossellomorea aquimaris]|uniref:RNA polymerase sigma factor SigY n=1 Tax=Rossellomorea aquimaris TaxID=189382 RepID=UPI001CD70D90|nr:RNA polymerase sigma factor SigY [Rossellomorea aquimaris]MCA1059657.1 RNA polymerase sigma factor SigY [Rossellomorea aquimaris]